jgi:hypothetical protein
VHARSELGAEGCLVQAQSGGRPEVFSFVMLISGRSGSPGEATSGARFHEDEGVTFSYNQVELSCNGALIVRLLRPYRTRA